MTAYIATINSLLNQNRSTHCFTVVLDTTEYISAVKPFARDSQYQSELLARDAFVRTNRRAIGVFFRPSVCWSGTGVHYDHTVHVSADLSLWLDSPMFWAP